MDEKDRAHLTRTSDTSCTIEGDFDDERKTRKTLMSTMPHDCWNCRVYHWTAVQNLFKRLERRIVSVSMRTVDLWQPWFLLRWQRGCSSPGCFRQRSGHMDKPVLKARANLHKYKMKLLPVSDPRLCDESRFVLYFLGGANHQHVDHATTSSCTLVLKARCQVVSLSRLGQTRCCGHDVHHLIHAVSRRS